MRYCNRCGRPLDAEHHDLGDPSFVTFRRGRGRLPLQRVRIYGCKVRLTSVDDAERTSVPDTPQRTKSNRTAYRHESRFA
jgi:hypothetical protein